MVHYLIIRVYQDTWPHNVIRLAGVVSGSGANLVNPGRFFYENSLMGTQLVHYVYRPGAEKVVAIATICAYPKVTPVPFTDENLWNGYPEETIASYGLPKKMLLVQAQAYRQHYGFHAIHLLTVNSYGPRDNSDLASSHVIAASIKKPFDAIENAGHKFLVWGDGSPTREFLFVEDCAEAIVLAAERHDKPDRVHIGTRTETSIKDLVELIARLTGFRGRAVLLLLLTLLLLAEPYVSMGLKDQTLLVLRVLLWGTATRSSNSLPFPRGLWPCCPPGKSWAWPP